MKYKNAVSVVLSLTILFSQTACSLFAPHQEFITVMSSESDAEVYINGQLVGKGIGTLQVPRDQAASVMAKKPGYIPATQTVPIRFSTTGILDLLGGLTWLIPFIGATSPGFWQHEYTNVSLGLMHK
jgi:hypothetical protein